jgi:hypothetical protein
MEELLPQLLKVRGSIVIAKLKKYKSLGNDQTPTDIIQAGGEALLSEIHTFIPFILSKEELPEQWKKFLLHQFTRRAIKLTVADIEDHRRYQLHTKFYPISFSHAHVHTYKKLWRKKCEHNETVRQLFIDFKKAYDSVRREVLYNILIKFGVPIKLVRLTTKHCDV